MGTESLGQGELETASIDYSFEFYYKSAVSGDGCVVKALFS